VLLIVWEKKTDQEEAAARCQVAVPCLIDCILEVRPTGKTSGMVVWEWHA
jgi:hypothetical protein